MNIGLLSILHNKEWDFRPDMAQAYATALKNAIELQLDNDIEKQHGYFLSKKGYKNKDGQVVGADFCEKLFYSDIHVGSDKTYVGNIESIERHLYYNDEELADDDQIINVVVVDGPITRDGGGCSYGSKDWRDQVMYANTIPQVIGHLFVVNTPGGEAASRNDYEMMFNDCRKNGKPTVAFVDGMCCSSGINLACRCDRVVVMNPKDEVGCIGTMAAFWAVAHDTVDQDGYRYVELVGKDCPEKNAWYRDAAKGEYEKLQADLDKDTVQFHNTVRENRPLVTDDMLSGKVFEAQEVIPALVDEIGDMDRAIECVFALANEEMQAARFAVETPEATETPEEKTETPKNENDMTEQEMKVAEVAEQPATTQEATGQPEVQEKTPATEEAPVTEEQPADEEAPATDEAPANEEQPAEEPAAAEAPATEEAPAEEQPAEETIENAQAEIDKIQETLHNAETMIAEKDKVIESLKAAADQKEIDFKAKDETIASLTKERDEANKSIEENVKTITAKDDEIQKLKAQVDSLKAEVKELSEKPAPMVDASAGVPAGNGTGEAPKQKQSKYHRGMSYKEYREAATEK